MSGAPIQDVFPPVPPEDYLAAIWERDAKRILPNVEKDPVYGVLNVCRVLWYVREARIASKEEAGTWAASALPKGFHEPVEHALELYRGDTTQGQFDTNLLKRFATYMRVAIESEIGACASANDK